MANTKLVSMEDLWRSPLIHDRPFDPDFLTNLPPVAKRYLETAISPQLRNTIADKPLASAVRLWMHGEIKLGQQWHPFKGEEVIHWQRGMVWRATTWMKGLPIWGADRLVDGVGSMQWKMLGLFPVMQASGQDVSRSGVGRVQGEAVWLPSVLCQPEIGWLDLDESTAQANFTIFGEPAHLVLSVNHVGLLESVKLARWGNPAGDTYGYVNFGGIVEKNETFSGYTIPTRLRIGWFFGGDRFASEGEFFRCTIDNAIYR
ncbi:DUF6920 family protein [[Limnothrix rosea] IAM M-220]|uniref:DUF6920 family protein n=1 Tax=[Limnothrix rosea] IAM M-220 TaxID=454133 RepID=UPI0009FE6E16|nr:DUF6544 family protein [[Limnothrix rosea] IAM M-220]